MAHQAPGASSAPPRVVRRLPVQEFLAEQHAIAELKSDWLYRLCGPEGRAKLAIERGFTPVFQRPARSTNPTYRDTPA